MSKRLSQNSDGRLVYSTDGGRQCPQCRQTTSTCRCSTSPRQNVPRQPVTGATDPGDGVVRLHLERKGRKGKGVTLVRGLNLGKDELAIVAKHLKMSCGVGGAVKDGVIELQSVDRDKIRTLLETRGHRVKLAGG